MLIIAIIVGAVLAFATDDAFPGLAGALLAWLAWRSVRQQRRIDELAAELRKALGAAAQPSVSGEDAAPAAAREGSDTGVSAPAAGAGTAPLPSEEYVSPRAAPAMTMASDAAAAAEARRGPDSLWDESVPVPTLSTAATATTAPTAAQAAAAAAAPGLLARLRGWLFGGNTIVKAGVGILFVGLAFLAKYASEHVQVPVEWRLAGISAVALVLLALGWRLRERRAGYAQVLQGGAIAVLYLTLFVAFRYYGVLAAGPVFVLMVVVAALAAALAVLQDAKALALVGALGGYATPLLISTGSGNHVALFGYYLVLNFGVAAVAWFRDWRALNLVGFFATFLVGSVWGVLQYRSSHYASSQLFLIANFLLFNAIGLMPARRAAHAASDDAADATGGEGGLPARRSTASRRDTWVNGTLLFGVPTITFVLQHGLVRHTEYGTALSALALAAFYVGLALWMRGRAALAVTFEASLAIATVFLTLVIPFALDARSTAGAWALEGAGLVWLGCRQRRGAQRAFGYALLLLAGLAMGWALQRGMPDSVWNATLFNALMAAAASLGAAYFVHRAALGVDAGRGALAQLESLAEPALIGWAMLWLLGAASVQIDAFVAPRLMLAAWLASLSAIALLCVVLARRLDWPGVSWPATAHAPLVAFGALLSAVLLLVPTEHGGAWAWPVTLAVHLLVLRGVARRWPAPVAAFVHALGALVLATLLALQGRAITADWGEPASAWAWLGWGVGPAVLLALLSRPGLAARWPLREAPAAYRSGAAAVLAGGLLAWTLLANVESNGAASPLPYLPFVNPLDLGIGAVLAAAAVWWRSEAAEALRVGRERIGIALLGGCGFVWLNAMLVRAFHHHGDVPFRFDAWTASLPVQTGLTLLWTVTALVLMWLSARRAQRAPWVAGAVLLGAVVLKLLLVDLSGSGTVTRIVSFIGVGVLMLVIGYVAPLPAKEERRAVA